MSLNSTPLGERVHISFFGKRNAGKSSLVNAITGQTLSVVSEEKGTTTDPVYKSMELLPLGPVVIIDTPGFDDFGKLGNLRIKKTREVMRKTDLAVLVIDIQDIISNKPGDNVSFSDIYTLIMESEKELIALFKKNEIPCIIVANKVDLLEKDASENLFYQMAFYFFIFLSHMYYHLTYLSPFFIDFYVKLTLKHKIAIFQGAPSPTSSL